MFEHVASTQFTTLINKIHDSQIRQYMHEEEYVIAVQACITPAAVQDARSMLQGRGQMQPDPIILLQHHSAHRERTTISDIREASKAKR